MDAETKPLLKTPAGRLREAGAREILRLRSLEHPETREKFTYQQIAAKLGVSIGTVFNVCKARTWSWLGGEYGKLS